MINVIEWLDTKIRFLDQTKLPSKIVYVETADYHEIISAIKELRIRGAPAIGIASAYGIALGALNIKTNKKDAFSAEFNNIIRAFKMARPTAVNLFRTIERMERIVQEEQYIESIRPALISLAQNIHAEEKANCRKISQYGSELIRNNTTILTHCNTGALATAAEGTALGIIFACHLQEKKINVFITETRPLMQGARLTAWELLQEKVPFVLITDSAAGYFMSMGKINYVIVGADRIAVNGDTANKIGTYSLAVLAHENNIPFYIAAPTSTIDMNTETGDSVNIEERNPDEITTWADINFAPTGTKAINPAFDITPNKYITAIITEKGIVEPPFEKTFKTWIKEN